MPKLTNYLSKTEDVIIKNMAGTKTTESTKKAMQNSQTFEKLSPELLRQHKGISFVGITTCFICHDNNGNIFMAKRSNNARDEHGNWDIGGGGLKWGVTATDNVIREIEEEYSATPLKISFLGYRDVFRTLPDGTPNHWLALDFTALVNRDDIKINEPDMFDDSGWFTLEDLPSPLHSQLHIVFEKYKNELSTEISSSRHLSINK